MKVLIACEFSGVVRDAFIAKGHDAVSCDLLPTETPGHHYQGDVFDIINNGFDLMIAFPPCTHLSSSGAAWFAEKRKDGRQRMAIEFFLRIANAPIKKIAIENPVGIMSSIYRKPDQIIQPYFFGDDDQKTTCLWLKNLPKLFHAADVDLFNDTITHVAPVIITTKNGYRGSRIHFMPPGRDRGKLRSKTFPGIAYAMAMQWG